MYSKLKNRKVSYLYYIQRLTNKTDRLNHLDHQVSSRSERLDNQCAHALHGHQCNKKVEPYPKTGAKGYAVIRFKIKPDELNKIDKAFAASMGGNNIEPVPSTGHGHLMAGNGTITPEYKLDGELKALRKGAELYIVDVDGKETLIAKYNEGKWEKI